VEWPDVILALGRLAAALGALGLLAFGHFATPEGTSLASFVVVSNGAGVAQQVIKARRNGNGNGNGQH
jgi:hypothetical protein